MSLSILPISLMSLFMAWIYFIHMAKHRNVLTTPEVRSVYSLTGMLAVWTVLTTVLGVYGVHTSPVLLQRVPFLWQACIPVILLSIALVTLPPLRLALPRIAHHTPAHWLVFLQGLRVFALGGVIKGISGVISSDYVLWVGIPDFIYGLSAILVGYLTRKQTLSDRFLLTWNLIGPAIILLPTFGFMTYFMDQPGFVFIFEFPMVLAPSIVVPMLIFFNFLHAWDVYQSINHNRRNHYETRRNNSIQAGI